MKTTALQRNIHVSSQKANLVCDLIRGKSIVKALVILDHTPNKSARIIKKLLNSAIANATNNHAMSANNLYIYQITANEGSIMKRMRPRAKGSGSPIRKRLSNFVITLSDDKNERKNDVKMIKERLAKRTNNNKKNKSHSTVKKLVTKTEPKIKISKGENK